MAQLKFALWNIEWMNELFDSNPTAFKPDATKGYRTGHTTLERRTDISGVINEIDSDIWVVVEGPNQQEELQLFFDSLEVTGNWTCAVQPSGAQSLGIAVRTDTGKFATSPLNWFDVHTAVEAELLKKATNEFRMDTDHDDLEEVHKFERRPLYCAIHMLDGTELRVLGLHLKSKGIFQAYEWTRWWSKADGNRKKIIAQCFQLRKEFIDLYLSDDSTKDIPLLVCGDINDGPGFDTSEMKIQSSGIERLMGSIWKPELTLGNAIYDTLPDKDKSNLDFSDLYTASFADPIFNRSYRRSWIDHILYSHSSKNWISDGAIIHKMQDGEYIYKKYPASSDHRPVMCIITTDNIIV